MFDRLKALLTGKPPKTVSETGASSPSAARVSRPKPPTSTPRIIPPTAPLVAGIASAGASKRLPIDINEPVENPRLAMLIDRLATDDSPEVRTELLDELARGIYLAAMLENNLRTRPGDEPGQSVVEEASTIGLLSTRDEQGRHFLPLFTDWIALRHATDGRQVNGLVLPAADAWGMVLGNEAYEGIVVRTVNNALPLERPMIEFLAQHITFGGAPG